MFAEMGQRAATFRFGLLYLSLVFTLLVKESRIFSWHLSAAPVVAVIANITVKNEMQAAGTHNRSLLPSAAYVPVCFGASLGMSSTQEHPRCDLPPPNPLTSLRFGSVASSFWDYGLCWFPS
ncbi:hypothetical protein BCR41DRAFT_373802 [Lobosporangium transversale]|uniref:Uncharacterized protein n=1 Tax=Lobosporangium transversale TaxID=64571 RepID=A0A1Y2GDT9_9FUNG|nr:hypothetical protein BCR41DRAFT_373802 [Lobosporangium transversale]ORZ07027.1 hypothetical protein BCR41DRAFT_373802 [Lobosporangium transversale]|eukprot:XP_021877823.1 hypothetical protein BCR41DRAFT_373802 [Lobosporangium transversale]